MDFQNFYQKRVTQFQEREQELKAQYGKYSLVRLLTFFLGAAIVIFCFSTNAIMGFLVMVVLLAAFAKFVFFHEDIKHQQHHQRNLKTINENEVNYLLKQVTEFDNGEQYLDADHPYAVDMDIFGDYSIYQYYNRTVTSIGQQTFADYLRQQATYEEIYRRQEATKELQQKFEWMQHFQAFGKSTKDQPQHILSLLSWLEDAPIVLGKKWLVASLWIVPIIVLGFMFLPGAVWPHHLKWAIFFLPGILLLKRLEAVNEIHQKTNKAGEILDHYSKLLAHIESKEFTSKKLSSLRNSLFSEGETVSKRLGKLAQIIHQLNLRNNFFAIFLNLFTLWDLQYVYRLEKWKAAQKDQLEGWFRVLKEFDAMNSFGMLYFNHPDWTFPEVTQQETPRYEVEQVGHPLISKTVRVNNDLLIENTGHMKLITGSNMGGKSTFLRSVGLSIVFAMIGAPVCAKRLRLPLLQVCSSMRTKDALHENTSSFYAELKRLKFIIEAVESGQPIFFLLDEILKGTNSHDRHSGSKALILQFIKHKGVGLIATHDLELGYLETNHPKHIENLCFEVEVEQNELNFDYKVKKGVSKSLNATILMQKMGIDILEK